MTRLVKCPICGQTKRIDHSGTHSFNCCGIRLPIEGHVIYEGSKRPKRIIEKDKDEIDLSSFSEEELREIIREVIKEAVEENQKQRVENLNSFRIPGHMRTHSIWVQRKAPFVSRLRLWSDRMACARFPSRFSVSVLTFPLLSVASFA